MAVKSMKVSFFFVRRYFWGSFRFRASGSAFQKLRVLPFDPQLNFASILMSGFLFKFSKKYFFGRSKNIFRFFFWNFRKSQKNYFQHFKNFRFFRWKFWKCKFPKIFSKYVFAEMKKYVWSRFFSTVWTKSLDSQKTVQSTRGSSSMPRQEIAFRGCL